MTKAKRIVRFGFLTALLAALGVAHSISTGFAASGPVSIGPLPCQGYLNPKLDPLKFVSARTVTTSIPVVTETLSPEQARTLSPSGVNGYFAMTRKFGRGTFEDLRKALPEFRKMGINTLWLSPVNPQTTQYFAPLNEENNHGYWILDHSAVDPALGGEAALRRLFEDAKALGIDLCLDIVLNHFGYLPWGTKVPITLEGVSVNDPAFFKTFDSSGPFILPRQSELYGILDNETDPVILFAAQRELALLSLYKLNSLRHENPLVRDYLFNSVKRFIDMGFTRFRMDAVKHYSLDFFVDFVNEMNDYAAAQGKELTFIVELLFYKSNTLSVFAKHILERVRDHSRLFFLDFPMALELRRVQDRSYKFSWMMGFIQHRMAARASGLYPAEHFIPMIEDHDFGVPIANPFVDRLAYTLTEFVSFNSTITHHGTEQSGSVTEKRAQISGLKSEGDIQKLKNRLAQVLAPYRLSQGKDVLVDHVANDDLLVLERKLPDGRSVVLAVNKGDAPFSTRVQFAPTSQFTIHVVEGVESSRPPVAFEPDSTLSIELPPHSFVVFERIP